MYFMVGFDVYYLGYYDTSIMTVWYLAGGIMYTATLPEEMED